jgi:hypothetical protein
MPSTMSNETSLPPACITWPAAVLAFADHLVGRATSSAPPAMLSEREPPVPPPFTQSLSPCFTVIALERHAEPLGHDLRERGLVALAVGLRADMKLDAAIVGELHRPPARCPQPP